jgi:hypothetical protein
MPSGNLNERLIAERIATLLAHYWTPETSVEVRSHLASDWLADLREFPAPIVAEAVQRYRQSADFRKRPMPGDIRMHCIAIQRESAPPSPLALPDQRELREIGERRTRFEREAAEIRESYAKGEGFPSFKAMLEAKVLGAKMNGRRVHYAAAAKPRVDSQTPLETRENAVSGDFK